MTEDTKPLLNENNAAAADYAYSEGNQRPAYPASNISTGCVLTRDQNPMPTGSFTLPVDRNESGVVCVIDRDQQLLWNYFLTYLKEKPGLKLVIEVTEQEDKGPEYQFKNGAHDPFKKDPFQHSDHFGKDKPSISSSKPKSVFKIEFNLDYYISEWSRVYASDNSGSYKALGEILQQYCDSNAKFKEIEMNRQILGWDLKRLETNLRNLVSMNFALKPNQAIKVDFVHSNHKIAAYPRSPSEMCSAFCCLFLTCMWPAYLCESANNKFKMVAEYQVNTSEADFYRSLAPQIVGAIHKKTVNAPVRFFQ